MDPPGPSLYILISFFALLRLPVLMFLITRINKQTEATATRDTKEIVAKFELVSNTF